MCLFSFKYSLIVQHAKKRGQSHGLSLIPRRSFQPLILLLKLCPCCHSFILISLQKTLLGVALTNPVLQKEAQGATLPTAIPLQKQRTKASADAAVCLGAYIWIQCVDMQRKFFSWGGPLLSLRVKGCFC